MLGNSCYIWGMDYDKIIQDVIDELNISGTGRLSLRGFANSNCDKYNTTRSKIIELISSSALFIHTDEVINPMSGAAGIRDEYLTFSTLGHYVIEEFKGDYTKYKKSKKEHWFWRYLTRIGGAVAVLLGLIKLYQFLFVSPAVDYSEEIRSINKEILIQDSLIQVLIHEKDSVYTP